ncbi:alanine racemase [Microbacterium sp. KUDC0406]|uniref:alanine racemase n=1 Tax=Microbacterium sp. KUDC0406 TaxID=2909588 RepID=UPI001F2EE03F|nr:alanine racemase [Microbacterium sp. KUDC0406]UJP11093.1 alanine racemase [Microbacterium sp. KUDC0406]
MNVPVLEISRAVLQSNIAAVRAQIAPSELMLVMKDDAYGHGVEWTVDGASDVSWFGSYDIASALRIRARREDARVYAWATSTDAETAQAIEARIDLGVGTLPYLRRVIAQAERLGAAARVHLKIDTGLHRNGVRPEDWAAFVAEARAAERRGVLAVVGVWSHLAEASDAEDDDAALEFRAAVQSLRDVGGEPEALHLTASAASWWRPELRGTLSRVGAFCYGIRSADGPQIPGVVPVAELCADVLSVRGDVAEIGIGAFDGLPSTVAGADIGTPAGARMLREIGAMSSFVETWPGASEGDRVTVFGRGSQGEQDATSLAERIGTVGEEILLRLTPRVQRVEVD